MDYTLESASSSSVRSGMFIETVGLVINFGERAVTAGIHRAVNGLMACPRPSILAQRRKRERTRLTAGTYFETRGGTICCWRRAGWRSSLLHWHGAHAGQSGRRLHVSCCGCCGGCFSG